MYGTRQTFQAVLIYNILGTRSISEEEERNRGELKASWRSWLFNRASVKPRWQVEGQSFPCGRPEHQAVGAAVRLVCGGVGRGHSDWTLSGPPCALCTEMMGTINGYFRERYTHLNPPCLKPSSILRSIGLWAKRLMSPSWFSN